MTEKGKAWAFCLMAAAWSMAAAQAPVSAAGGALCAALFSPDFVQQADAGDYTRMFKQTRARDCVRSTARDADGWTAFMWAAAYGRDGGVLDVLAEVGAEVNATDRRGRGAAFQAARHNADPAILEKLAALGADFKARDEDGMTTLMAAARNPNPDMVATLVSLGIEVDARDHSGTTALMEAALWNPEGEVGKRLLALGANATLRNDAGLSADELAQRRNTRADAETYDGGDEAVSPTYGHGGGLGGVAPTVVRQLRRPLVFLDALFPFPRYGGYHGYHGYYPRYHGYYGYPWRYGRYGHYGHYGRHHGRYRAPYSRPYYGLGKHKRYKHRRRHHRRW